MSAETQQNTGETNDGNTKKLRSRHWCFTLNNYTATDIELILREFKSYTFQEETGASGTKHLQGVVSYTNARSWDHLKGILPTAHIERCRSIKHSIEYCSKIETRTGRVYSTQKILIEDPLEGKDYYPWQKEIIDIIYDKPDPRKIYWYWEEKGNVGKSDFAKHLFLKKKAYVLGGKAGDMAYAIGEALVENPHLDTVIIDIPRCVEHISYNGIEQVKNGLVFSPKYESKCIAFNRPHIIIFANVQPDSEMYKKFSTDKWVIRKIE